MSLPLPFMTLDNPSCTAAMSKRGSKTAVVTSTLSQRCKFSPCRRRQRILHKLNSRLPWLLTINELNDVFVFSFSLFVSLLHIVLLRVIQPFIISAHTQAPVFMIAERAADFIRAEDRFVLDDFGFLRHRLTESAKDVCTLPSL